MENTQQLIIIVIFLVVAYLVYTKYVKPKDEELIEKESLTKKDEKEKEREKEKEKEKEKEDIKDDSKKVQELVENIHRKQL